MKGVILAGGLGSRLRPLTLVTNKHLLPIYDRPMIYCPIETLAGMGIREVMVIVGGKSVGDVVELLADGSHFGLDLTYRYQHGALGIAHAIGLARGFVGDEAFCVVLGDNILRGPALADTAPEFEAGPWDAGALLYRVPDPERFGVAELEERFGVVLPAGLAVTIAGRLTELAVRIPAAGTRLLVGGLEIHVLQASPVRVERLVVRPGSPAPLRIGDAP